MKIPAKQLAAVSMLAAAAAVVRVGLGAIALSLPTPLYGVLIKVSLCEVVAYACGFAFGMIPGFATGALAIVVSDVFMLPGPWTPFIAFIIGLVGLAGGVSRHVAKKPSITFLAGSAVALTAMSELLQTVWFALFFGIPLVAAFVTGIPTTIAALVNNTVLFTALTPRILRLLQGRPP
jgi:uncharacterized membrane protein